MNILLGKENVDRIWDKPWYDDFADLSDKILYAAIETPCTIIGEASDYIGMYALATGNIPLAATTTTVGKVTDAISFGTAILKAYNSDDWSDVFKMAASKSVSTFISYRISKGIADIRVFKSQKNGGYYQKGHRGRLSDKKGMRKMFIQTMAPDIGKKAAGKLFDHIMDEIKKNEENFKDE